MTSSSKPSSAGFFWLVAVAAMWGLGFVVTQDTLRELHPLWSNSLRFLLAAPVAVVAFRKRITWDAAHLKAGLITSLFLSGTFTLQTLGLAHTTVGKSSLITGMYAVFTPLLAPLFNAPRPSLLHVFAALVALGGLALVGDVSSLGLAGFNVGDALTLGCALIAAGHIHVVGKAAPGKDAFALNALQLCGCAVWCLIMALAFGGPVPTHLPVRTGMALLYLGTFSSVLAFGIQMWAQQTLSPSAVGTLLLMETPFGMLFGVLLLGETVGLPQLAGAVLILAGCLLSVRADEAAASPPG